MSSLWNDGIKLPQFPALKQDITTDVLIIGGGMAGILTAYFLHQKGVSYVLAEKARICSGVTGNTTAKITSQHGLIYHKIAKRYGINTAKLYLQANQLACACFEQLCHGIQCDYQKKDNYVFSLNDRYKVDEELVVLKKLGCSAELAEDLPLPFTIAGAVRFCDQAQFHPLKFVAAIVKDMRIYENTFVREMVGTTAVTDNGKIRAKKVIVTTHFPFLNKHGSYFLKLYQHRSYAIAIKNAGNVQGMYVDDEKNGLSFRNYKDYLIIGGGGHRTGNAGGNWAELRCFAQKHYPHAQECFHWATQDCMSLDQIPYIGQYSVNTPTFFVASGFNKWGMTGSMVSAMILSDLVMSRKNQFANIFSPSRSILHPQLFYNAAESVKNLLSFSSKRCPHLGCALKWNAWEHTWDCPCHGSRFSEKGEVLDNPANGDLRF